jgi:hypothetical protein
VIRVEAYRQCVCLRRPDVYLAEDVGLWKDIMDAMTVLGIYCNVAIFCWTGNSLMGYNTVNKFLIFLCASQILLIIKNILQGLLEKYPKWIEQLDARQRYIVRKHLHGADDNEDRLEETTLSQLDTDTDVDGLSLYDFRGNKKMTKAEVRQNDELEKKRRQLQMNLQLQKDLLEQVYKSENYNTKLGISETKDRIPLGLLEIGPIKLIYKENTSLSSTLLVCIHIDIISHSEQFEDSKRNPLYILQNDSRTNPVMMMDSSNVEFNGSVGPFVAIRTIHASVRVQVREQSNSNSKNENVIIGQASMPLNDFKDQTYKDRIFHLNFHPNAKGLDLSGYIVIMNARFQYSKIVPLRQNILDLQEELTSTEKELSQLKVGQLHENNSF